MKNLLVFPLLLGLAAAAQADMPTLNALSAMNANDQKAANGSPTDAKFYAAQVPDGYGAAETGAVVSGPGGEPVGTKLAQQVQPVGPGAPPPLTRNDKWSMDKGFGGLGINDFLGAGIVGGATAALGVLASNLGWISMGAVGAGFLGGGIGLVAGFMMTHEYPLTGAGMLLGPALGAAIMGSALGPWGIVGGFAVGALVGFVGDKLLPGLLGGGK